MSYNTGETSLEASVEAVPAGIKAALRQALIQSGAINSDETGNVNFVQTDVGGTTLRGPGVELFIADGNGEQYN